MVVDEQYLDEQYIKNLGILGSRIEKQTEAMEDLSDDFDQFFLDNRRDRGNGIVSRDGLADADPDEFISDLVGAMRATTYTVKVSNFVGGLLRPLSEQFEDMHYENMEFSIEGRRVVVGKLDRILIALEQLKGESVTFFNSAVGIFGRTLNTLRFIKEHPGLAVLKTLGSVIGVIFGRDRKTDNEKIVRSNDRITEAIVKGQTDDRESVWETFRQGGLLKLAARGVARGLGGEEAAQERKDAREMGIEVEKSFRGVLLDNFYKGFLVDKTREKLQEETNRDIDDLVDGSNDTRSLIDILNSLNTTLNGLNISLNGLNISLNGLNSVIIPKMNQSVLDVNDPCVPCKSETDDCNDAKSFIDSLNKMLFNTVTLPRMSGMDEPCAPGMRGPSFAPTMYDDNYYGSNDTKSFTENESLNTALNGLNTVVVPKMNQSVFGMNEPSFFSTMSDVIGGSFVQSSITIENQKANKISEQEQQEKVFRERQEDLLSSLERNSSQTYKTTKEMNSRQDDMHGQNKRIVKWSKEGVKEQAKTRRMIQLKAILGFLGGIVSTALTIGSDIISGLATVATAIAGLLGIKAILKKGFSKLADLLKGVLKKIPFVGKWFDKPPKTAPKGTPKPATAPKTAATTATKAAPNTASVASKAAPSAPSATTAPTTAKASPKLGKGMGVLTAGLSAYSAWNEKSAELEERDDLTDTQKNIQKTGTAAGAGVGAYAGAATGLKVGAGIGATIGSFIAPGLGTAVGTAIGGTIGTVIGGIAGSELGQFVGDKMSGLVSGFFGKEEKTIGDQLQEKTDDLSVSMDEFKEKSEGFFSSAFGTVSKWYKDAKGYFFGDGGVVDEMKDGTDSLRHTIDKNTKTAKDVATSTLDATKRIVDASLGVDGKKESETTTVSGDKFKGSLKKQEEFINESAIKRHESLVKLMGDFYSEKDEENTAKLKTIEAEYNANIAKYQQIPTDAQEATKGFFARLWDGIKSALKKAASWIGGVAKSAWGKVKGWFGSDEEEKIIDAVKKETKPEEKKEGFFGGNSSKSWFGSDEEEPVVDAVKKETKPEEKKEGFFGGMWNSAKSWFSSDEEEPVVDAVKSQETPWKTERSEDGSVVTRTFTGQGSMRDQLVKEQQEALEQYKATGNIEQRPDEDLGDFYRRRETIKQLASAHGIKAGSSPTVKGISEPMGTSDEQRQNQLAAVKETIQTPQQKANSDAIAASINDMKSAIMQFIQSAAQTGQEAVSKFENVIEENDFMNVTGR